MESEPFDTSTGKTPTGQPAAELNLTDYLATRARRIDALLDELLPPEQTHPYVLHRAMRYAVLSGGKRLRPILCLAACDAVRGAHEAALVPAAAIEVLHAYTLVHDDLPSMDNDSERRGKPTVHVAFGEANAILTGDALQAFAFELLGRGPFPARWGAEHLVAELAAAAGSQGVVGGQVEDLTGDRQADVTVIRRIHERKTAGLFRAALRMGAMAAEATPAQVSALGAYGVSLGLAFQITDDLLDTDRRNLSAPETRETTCLSVYSPADARRRASQYVDAALRALDVLSPAATAPLVHLARFILKRTH